RLTHEQLAEQWKQETAWRERERLAWLMPPGLGKESPTRSHLRAERERRDRQLAEHRRYLARDYQGMKFDSPGILAARAFYAQGAEAESDPHVRLHFARLVEPVTDKQPY